jgi:hypothetical protein
MTYNNEDGPIYSALTNKNCDDVINGTTWPCVKRYAFNGLQACIGYYSAPAYYGDNDNPFYQDPITQTIVSSPPIESATTYCNQCVVGSDFDAGTTKLC